MVICFGSAVVFLSKVQPLPEAKPKPVEEKTTLVRQATPPLTKAITNFRYRLVVDLSDAKVYAYWGNKRLSDYPVAIGKAGWETPTGSFQVRQKQRNPAWQQPITGEIIAAGPNNPLGDRWIGFFSEGIHQIGFHGTNEDQLVGQAVSHGCLRMRNEDIRTLYEQISLGTPIIVRD